jgi:CDP-diglyceride synthetase
MGRPAGAPPAPWREEREARDEEARALGPVPDVPPRGGIPPRSEIPPRREPPPESFADVLRPARSSAPAPLPGRPPILTPIAGNPVLPIDPPMPAMPDDIFAPFPDVADQLPVPAEPDDPDQTMTLPRTERRRRRAENFDPPVRAEDAEAAVEHGRAGRNLPAAIGVGVLLGGLALVSLFTRPEAFVALASLVVVLAVWELAGAMAAKQIVVPVIPVAVGSLGMLVSAYVAGEEGLLVSFALTGFGVLLWRIIDGVEGALRDVTAGLFTAAYVPLLGGFAVLLLADTNGPRRVVTFILVTVASDIGGYIAGVLAGKHPMAPTISPKKSWEGFAGSVFFCLLTGTGCVVLLLDDKWWVGLALGAAAAVTATLGDLSESLLKRDLGVKDMGSLLPGHGGIMDRLDSLLPTAPVAYLLLHLLISSK